MTTSPPPSSRSSRWCPQESQKSSCDHASTSDRPASIPQHPIMMELAMSATRLERWPATISSDLRFRVRSDGARSHRRSPIPASPFTSWCRSRPAASPTCSAARSAQRLTEAWGQQVVIENKPGGGAGQVGTDSVAKVGARRPHAAGGRRRHLRHQPAHLQQAPVRPDQRFCPDHRVSASARRRWSSIRSCRCARSAS